MRTIFDSVLAPNERRFVLDTDRWDYSNRGQVDHRMLYFETMGDGNTAHSPDRPITRAMMIDWMLSAALYMADSSDDKFASEVSFMATPVYTSDIAFAASVRHKEFEQWDKRQRYSLDLRKVSAAPKYEHDKRWEVTSEWMDGTQEATARLLYKSFWDPFSIYACHESVRDWYIDKSSDYGTMPLDRMGDGWTDAGRSADVHNAFRHMRDIARAINALKCSVSNARSLAENARLSQQLSETAVA